MSHEKSVSTGFGLGALIISLIMGTMAFNAFAEDVVPTEPEQVTLTVGGEAVTMTVLPEEADELEDTTPVTAEPAICNPDSATHCSEVASDLTTWSQVKAMAMATGLQIKIFFVGEDS